MITPPRVAVRRLALGRFISMTGSFAAGISLTFVIYEQTRSAAWISATAVFTWGLTGVLGPFAGAIGDRFDRRRVMVLGELAASVFWFAMVLVPRRPAALLALAFAGSVVLTPYMPASGAAIPNLAGEENCRGPTASSRSARTGR